ncbi:hypothetical protein BKA56DRAFT_568724 [Ilyonectria sp. MPI-CAGE-AT-0026]|nr:hypothetical protein BKA56DRAFT_568724 [Ilyonectria sp. MPI-CAGE-AT-0026]
MKPGIFRFHELLDADRFLGMNLRTLTHVLYLFGFYGMVLLGLGGVLSGWRLFDPKNSFWDMGGCFFLLVVLFVAFKGAFAFTMRMKSLKEDLRVQEDIILTCGREFSDIELNAWVSGFWYRIADGLYL